MSQPTSSSNPEDDDTVTDAFTPEGELTADIDFSGLGVEATEGAAR